MTDKVRLIVRVANTDLDGKKQVLYALTKIKGVSLSFANAVCHTAGVDKTQKLGLLTESDVKKLTDAIVNPQLPSWMLNRRKDYESGEDVHLLSGDLTFTQQNDVKRMSSTKSYRGLRLTWGLTVRGQQTKSNHRRSKSKNAAAAKRRGK